MRTVYQDESGDRRVTVAGWLVDADEATRRVDVRDQSGRATVVFDGDTDVVDSLDSLRRESVIEVSGVLVDQSSRGYTVTEGSIEVYSEPTRELPFQPSEADPSFGDRLRHRHLDFRRPEVRATFEIRSTALDAIRDRLREWGAIEVGTPVLVPSATDENNDQFEVSYPNADVHLSGLHSGQYSQLLIGGGFERIFSIEKSFGYYEDGYAHAWSVTETTMLSIESAFTDLTAFTALLEDLIITVHERVIEECSPQLDTLGLGLSVPDREFRRLSYEELLEIVNDLTGSENVSMSDDLRDVDWWTLQSARKQIGEYNFVVGHPIEDRDFNERADPEDPDRAKSFDLQDPGGFEIGYGGERRYDYEEMARVVADHPGIDPEQVDQYLDAFRDGMPPHVGAKIGLDRMIMGLLDLNDIREGIAFPRDRNFIA